MNKFLLILELSIFVFAISSAAFKVGDRVFARWTDNWYWKGTVSSIENEDIHIAFDDGDKITHSINDLSAVILDKPLTGDQLEFGQHVLVPYAKGTAFKMWYYWKIGYIYGIWDSRTKVLVFVDGGGKQKFYLDEDITLLTELDSPHSVGARVFARWTDGRYYRGVVLSATSTTVFVRYDDGDTITLKKDDSEAVVLDTLPCQSDITVGQRAIGFWSMWKQYRFYPGKVTEIKKNGQGCFQASYHIKFDDGDKRWQNYYEIRIFP